MTRLFRRQTRDWCIQALNDIEDGIARNVSSASNSVQGGITWASFEDAAFKIDQLNMRIDELDREAGISVPEQNGVIMRACYGRRGWR